MLCRKLVTFPSTSYSGGSLTCGVTKQTPGEGSLADGGLSWDGYIPSRSELDAQGDADPSALCTVKVSTISVHSSHVMHSNGPIANILDSSTSTFAKFGSPGGGDPWWVIFDLLIPSRLTQLRMKPFVAAESPKTMTVEVSHTARGPWSTVGTLSCPSAWDTPQMFSLSTQSVGEYVKLSITTSHNGFAPTIHYVEFYTDPPGAGLFLASCLFSQ